MFSISVSFVCAQASIHEQELLTLVTNNCIASSIACPPAEGGTMKKPKRLKDQGELGRYNVHVCMTVYDDSEMYAVNVIIDLICSNAEKTKTALLNIQ